MTKRKEKKPEVKKPEDQDYLYYISAEDEHEVFSELGLDRRSNKGYSEDFYQEIY